MAVEREVKLAVGPGFHLPELTEAVPGLRAEAQAPELSSTVYVDTDDLRVARWGCTLRFRTGQGWTVKLPPAMDGAFMLRDEFLFPGVPGRPPAEAVDLLRAYVRTGVLRPVARLRVRRTRVPLELDGGGLAGEVVDDEVSILEGRRVAARFREVEFEVATEAPPELKNAVLDLLIEAGAAEAPPVPKYLRALGPRAAAAPEVTPDVGLGSSSTVAQVISGAIAASVVRLLRHDAGIRIGEDPEAVHQARVATRRLRSDLRTFRDFLEQEWSAPLRDELRWLGDELGAVRDADVLLQRLTAETDGLPDPDLKPARRLLSKLADGQEAARARLLDSMRSERYDRLLDSLIEAARDPAFVPDKADRRAAAELGQVMAGPWSHLESACEGIHEDGPDAQLHAARIRAKRARYAAEALVPVFGKRAASFARAAAGLQEVLGEHQDAVLAAAWLRTQSRSGGSRIAFAAGRLAEREDRRRRSARNRWAREWKSLDRKKLRFWT